MQMKNISITEKLTTTRKIRVGEGFEYLSKPDQKDARATRTRIPCYRKEVLHVVGVFVKMKAEKGFGLFIFTKKEDQGLAAHVQVEEFSFITASSSKYRALKEQIDDD